MTEQDEKLDQSQKKEHTIFTNKQLKVKKVGTEKLLKKSSKGYTW